MATVTGVEPFLRAQPPRDGHREAARGAAGAHHHVQLRHRGKLGAPACPEPAPPLGEAEYRALTIVGVRAGSGADPHRLVQVTLEIVLAPAVVGEGAGMLG